LKELIPVTIISYNQLIIPSHTGRGKKNKEIDRFASKVINNTTA